MAHNNSNERSRADLLHIFQYVFDEQAKALKTIPGEETSFAVELNADDGDSVKTRKMAQQLTMLDSANLTTSNLESQVFNVLEYSNLFLSVSWDGATASNSYIELEYSADGVTFHPVNTITLNGPSGKNYYRDASMNCSHIKVKYTKASNNGGTITVKAVVKG